MRIRVFTLRYDELLGGFDESAFQAFIADKEVIQVTDHFFVREERPHLVLVVRFGLSPMSVSSQQQGNRKQNKRDESWKKLLEPDDYPLFNKFREWRIERSKKEGVARYVVCNNEQLALVARNKPKTLEQLIEIRGFGKAKVKKYGEEILSILSTYEEVVDDNT